MQSGVLQHKPYSRASSMLHAARTSAVTRLSRLATRRFTYASNAAKLEAVPTLRSLEELVWDNTFVKELPADPDSSNRIRQVQDALFSFVSPTPTPSEPYLVGYSPEVCSLLDLDPAECERPEFPLVFAGHAPLPGSKPYAQNYGGHQFGNWAGQLGDGRAISLGEVINSKGERWELQLKGAGKTPYSRFADGRAVLRSSIREFVASEAMHHLGVPTTRALCLVGTGDEVYRDMFYNGYGSPEPGAVVCRVAPSFVRFGTFQLPVSRGAEQVHLTKKAADYVIKYHFPHLQGSSDRYLQWLQEVVDRTARLVSAWQSVGFVHGVLNTDNMSILGLTIDYGPYGFLDKFDPYYTPNLTDMPGRRYAYRQQPEVCQWNLVQLATVLVAAELIPQEAAQEAVQQYSSILLESYQSRIAQKLGLKAYDKTLAVELLKLMYEDDADFTNAWRSLSSISVRTQPDESGIPAALRAAIGAELDEARTAAWTQWVQAYRDALLQSGQNEEERVKMQNAANPKYIPRQHLLQYAIEDAQRGDLDELKRLLNIIRDPYTDQNVDDKYTQPPPENMVRPGVTCLSCSS